MDKRRFNEGLLRFLEGAVTPYHAVMQMRAMLEKAGFVMLDERLPWHLEEGKRYFTIHNDSSIIAFTYPKSAQSYLLLGAHTDSPTLKLKPNPIIKREGLIQFNVEPYGGLLLNSWFDRDLSLAGKVNFLATDGAMQESIIDKKEPLCTISSLAIHLDDKANKERTINKQNHLAPILTCNEDFDFERFLLVDAAKKLLAFDLNLYDTQKAAYIGLHREFIASARLDNLLSCYINLQTLLHASDNDAILSVANDHEEVGSESSGGAAGAFLTQTLQRIFPTSETFVRAMRNSLLVSCDNAHAVHPNYADKHESEHKPRLNGGAVIKINANQRYASNVTTIARFKAAAQSVGEPTQEYVVRSDMGCGSTIGPITAARLGIETVDIGVPTLAMHSARELAGSDDAFSLFTILSRLGSGDNG